MAEQTGNYVVCDIRELLKIDGVYYLPKHNDWIQKPYYCYDGTDYVKTAIRMTSNLDRHCGLTEDQVKIAQDIVYAKREKFDKGKASNSLPPPEHGETMVYKDTKAKRFTDKGKASNGPLQSVYRITTDDEA